MGELGRRPRSAGRPPGARLRRARAWVAIGVNERESERPGTLYNTLLVIGPEGPAQRHRKLMPTHHERLFHGIGAGDDLDVVETPAGRVGGLICWENRMPLARYAVYRQGPQIWVAPTADDSDGWLASMRHIAIEAGAYVVSVPQYIPASAFPADFRSSCRRARRCSAAWGRSRGRHRRLVAGPLYDAEASWSPTATSPAAWRRSAGSTSPALQPRGRARRGVRPRRARIRRGSRPCARSTISTSSSASSSAASISYNGLLEPLGFVRNSEIEGERWRAGRLHRRDRGDLRSACAPLESDARPIPYDRYAVGIHQLASVRPIARRSTSAPRGCASGAPRSRAARPSTSTRPATTRVFFYDPDGIKLEMRAPSGLTARR